METLERQQNSYRVDKAGGGNLWPVSLSIRYNLTYAATEGRKSSPCFLSELPQEMGLFHVRAQREPHSDVTCGLGACWLRKLSQDIWISARCLLTWRCIGGRHGGRGESREPPALAVLGPTQCWPFLLPCPDMGKNHGRLPHSLPEGTLVLTESP